MPPATPVPAAAALMRLLRAHDTDDTCRDRLEHLRWPSGIRCDSDRISRLVRRKQFDCDVCRYQFSVTSGTVLHDSHLPLPTWLVAVYLMTASTRGVSASQMKRTLGVSYKTAWYLCHRIREAMTAPGREPREPVTPSTEAWGRGRARATRPGDAVRSFPRAVTATHRRPAGKHRDRYLDEAAWRARNRANPHLFRDTLTRLVTSGKIDYKTLTA